MAVNTTGNLGFKHIGFLPGYAPDYQLHAKYVQSSNATAIYHGDPVVISGGYVLGATSGTAAVDGILDSCVYIDSTGRTIQSPYVPASQTATVYVIDAAGALFQVQSNNTALTQANVNRNVGFLAGTGSTFTGLSGYFLDAGNIATTSTYPFRIVQLYSDYVPAATGINGANASSYNMAIVTFNNTDFRAGTSGT